ncbi:hypothetical protein [Pseudonocardia hydrocarbonoxydans]|uniref:Uncharacterized protein n=1 Tax=Pseudonocardia hydrocarbonoxydans TaxID=76726 RepID=A0A4Y3WXV7_9PSEU|nr:hypothetical protein [Pseudonocardia hydrocarbonoxydans]GEC22960.1 hypothetical protein PHY01_52430 [Pseudonocardia hydrocarbonoxydans]
MPARTDRSRTVEQPSPTTQARMITKSSVVTSLTVRAAGLVPARLDLAHVGTAEQQLGLTLGTVLIYIRAGETARAVADGWSGAAVGARSLAPAVAGRRPLLIGPTTVGAMVRFAGLPDVTWASMPSRAGGAVPAMLRIEIGPVTWEVCDATAYTSMLRVWRQAARLLGENSTEDE